MNLSAYRFGAAPAYGLALLFLVSFFNYLDRMVIAVMVEPIKRDLGLTDTEMGFVSGLAFALLYATMGLPLARIADRGSRKWLLAICLAIWSAMTSVTGMARNFSELFLARMGVGIGEAGCVPAAHSMIGDMFPPEKRAFAIGIFQAGGLLGMSIGLAAAGMAAQAYGWRAALVGIGLLGLPLALLLAFTMREPLRSAEPDVQESMLDVLKALVRRPAFVHLILGISIGSFASYGIAQWLPTFFIRSHQLSLAAVGLWGGLAGGIAGIVGAIGGGAIMIRLRPRNVRWELWVPCIGYLLCIPFYLLSFLAAGTVSAYAILAIGVAIASAGGGVAIAAIQSLAEPHRRATAVAVMMFLSSLIGLGLGPAAVGAISDALAIRYGTESLRYALMISTAFLAWASLHFWIASRQSGFSGATDSGSMTS